MNKIFALIVTICIGSDFIPENEKLLNYNQIFFKWPQINNSSMYRLYIDEFNIFNSNINSIIITDLQWDVSYEWYVCGFNNSDSLIECYDEFSFEINSLPNNFPDNINVLTLNDQQYNPGITLLDFESLNFSLALDYLGNPVWYANRFNFSNSKILATQFLPNGNILGFAAGTGYEFNLDSEVVFQTPDEYDLHHSIIKSNNNTYFFIDAEIEHHPCPDCDIVSEIPWQGDRFIELDLNGSLLWEWNTFNHFSLDEYNPFWIESYEDGDEFDWTHSNSVFYDENFDIVYMSIRNLSRITAVDYSSKDLLWNLGNSEFMNEPFFENDFGFSHQHSAQITKDNTLLFFDNGRDNNPEISRCLEIDFNEDQSPYLLWEHILPDSLLSLSRGECDRLDNGNTLISAGRTGNVIEVDVNNEIIWHLNVKTGNGIDVNIYRSERINNLYPLSFSYQITNLIGEYGSYNINNNLDNIHLKIYNTGWIDQFYNIELFNQNELLLIEEIFVLSNENEDVVLDINLNAHSNYILNVYPYNNSDLNQMIHFSINYLIGDINNDDYVDLEDIIFLINLILNNEIIGNADLNDDSSIDIFDIILLVNIII